MNEKAACHRQLFLSISVLPGTFYREVKNRNYGFKAD